VESCGERFQNKIQKKNWFDEEKAEENCSESKRTIVIDSQPRKREEIEKRLFGESPELDV
jgi:hypothetical protein